MTQRSADPATPTPSEPDLDPPTAHDAAVPAEFVEAANELSVGVAEVLPADGLAPRLARAASERRPLRVKLGIDPSGTELTLGHAVVLRKLRQFQDLGHTAVLIVGDFTGRVGDPTGRSEVRKVQSEEQVRANAATYLDQVKRILREDRLEVRYNSEWLATMDFSEVLGYTSLMTVARLLERDDFNKRYKAGQPISLMEFMYPLMQGLDSIFIDADIELGGTDQTYNNLVGRQLQTAMKRLPQLVITVPLLRGTDGADKMGKSLGNYVAIGEAPSEQYGKIMSISDDVTPHYAELTTSWNRSELEDFARLQADDPYAAKRRVAARVVELYWGADAAAKAAEEFTNRFSKKQIDAEALAAHVVVADGDSVGLIALLVAAGLATSNGDARRTLQQGGIKLDGVKLDPSCETLEVAGLDGAVLQRGKRQAVRLALD
ncbi:MAG TPA: tyrosine--tRNA ligase [Microthrixaceae bacterium]|nr:tyrosine--tRNA ligase [Microthrixaceae bacterium]HPB45272.1 tyrosine--tRNA ligase [Microthrixaceae bacterium]